MVGIQPGVLLEDHGRVALENLEEEDYVWAANVGGDLVDDELLVPATHVLPRDAHVVKASAHRHQVVHRLVGDCAFGVDQGARLFVRDAWQGGRLLREVLSSLHVDDVDPDEGMHNAGVQLQIACLLDPNLQAQLLLVRLLELLVELQRWLEPADVLGRSHRALAAVDAEGKAVAKGVL